MADPIPPTVRLLEIKKYPNRRLYDATRSCHVTLGELYDLVAAGYVVTVHDSKSGEDITNQVLLQALIERDPLKVTAVPTPLIHLMIQLNHQLITSWFDLGLRQVMEAYRATATGGVAPTPWASAWSPGASTQWPGAWGGMGTPMPGTVPPMGGTPSATSPLAWISSFLQPPPTAPPPPRSAPDDAAPGDTPPPADIENLQEQVAALAAELARLKAEREG